MAANGHEGLRASSLVWLDDDMVALRPWGFAPDTIGSPVHIWQGARSDRAYSRVELPAAHIPTACPHLLPEHGHLSLAVGSFGAILDEMLNS